MSRSSWTVSARGAMGMLTILTAVLCPRDLLCADKDDMLVAVRSANAAAVETILQQDPSLAFGGDPHLWAGSFLHFAAYCGYSNIVAVLLQHNAFTNGVGRQGSTPLHDAVRFRDEDPRNLCQSHAHVSHRDVAELLLTNGAFVDYPDEWGNSPLQVAVSNTLAEILLKHGANPNHLNLNGDNALLLATLNRDAERVELLVHYKADISFKNKDGDAPLMLAVEFDAEPIIRVLLANHADANTRNRLGNTPLHYAHRKEVVDLLLAHGAEVDAVNEEGSTPLCRAAFGGHTELATALLANKADVNFKCRYRSTPVHEAVFMRHPEVADLLRQHGGHE